MRKALIVVAFALLAACTPGTGEASKVVDLVKQYCGIAVNVADVAAALSAPNAAVTGAVGMAREICKQAQKTDTGEMEPWELLLVPAHHEWAQVTEQPKQDCVAIVNGVCIRKESK